MTFPDSIRSAGTALALAVAAVTLAGGCAATRQGGWREAIKVGDYQAAYSDLFETWRAGTADTRAEALRHAWRTPGIVAVARKDLVARIQPIAAGHAGDLASLTKAIKDGPLEDRLEFAKLVDRTIDVEGEIAAAYAKRAPAAAIQPAQRAPAPAMVPPVVRAPALEPVVKSPTAEAMAPPAAISPPTPISPPTSAVAKAPAKEAAPSALAVQVTEARKRAAWRCKGAAACDKAWAAAESFVAANSDMRIRTASATTIDTYPPIVIGEIGMKVERRPVDGDESELQLTVACRVGRLSRACPTAELRLYTAFPAYLRSSSAP